MAIDGYPRLTLELRALIFFASNAETAELTLGDATRKFNVTESAVYTTFNRMLDSGLLNYRIAGKADNAKTGAKIYIAGPVLMKELGY